MTGDDGPEAPGDAASSPASDDDSAGDDSRHAVVLDFLAHGRPDDDRPSYQKSPVAYALGERAFELYELKLDDEPGVGIGDRVVVEPREARTAVTSMRAIDYDDLTGGATSELQYAVEEVVERDERRFVDFYNEAQPITLRLHQLNLLPGIGKKLRNTVLDERKRKPFESFAELTDRVAGLHSPQEVIVDRIVEEVRDEDLKYQTFVGRDEDV